MLLSGLWWILSGCWWMLSGFWCIMVDFEWITAADRPPAAAKYTAPAVQLHLQFKCMYRMLVCLAPVLSCSRGVPQLFRGVLNFLEVSGTLKKPGKFLNFLEVSSISSR